jgi:hypothetical protein
MNNKRKNIISIRLSDSEKIKLEEIRKDFSFNSISDFLRFVGMNSKIIVKVKK